MKHELEKQFLYFKALNLLVPYLLMYGETKVIEDLKVLSGWYKNELP